MSVLDPKRRVWEARDEQCKRYNGVILMDPRRPNPSAPPVYRPNRTSPQMRSAAQPVYRPQTSPRSLQPKPAIPAQLGAPTAALKPPTAPPVYRPYQRSYPAQPKVAAINRAAAVQLMKKTKSGFSNCDASVDSANHSGKGSYKNSIHGEINALEDYLSNGGIIGEIKTITISSPPCKYCHLILTDLGLRDKVVAAGSGYGSCQGGSYGWFGNEGFVSQALQSKTRKNQNEYIDWVIERKNRL
jgi:Cytidine and deoxycytidylate deaminase zinc-binding region